jgi:shikimate kinase / 3-dehydroquinate synthase
MNKPILLIGLSGTGKSTIGPLLARRLRRRFVDTDALVEAEAGRSIVDIFATEGEEAFRRLETQALARALDDPGAVIATGGGIVVPEANERLLSQALVVWLAAKPETLAARLAASRTTTDVERPLLGAEPLTALRSQLSRRAPRYASYADWVVATDQLSLEQIVDNIALFVLNQHPAAAGDLVVTTPGGSYEVVVARDALDQLPSWLATNVPRGRAWIVSNDRIWPHHGARLLALLQNAGVAAQSFQIPDGEASKNLAVVSQVYDWLLRNRVERGDILIAYGGGVVGDLAGFVAATILRGIGLIQVPTTVLAMVDSAIGGKTGVDHPAGKNLIGAFHQPRLVLADTALLATMPPGERRNGWTEAIKHGVIADQALFDDLVAHEAALRALREPWTAELIRRTAAVKVRIVSGDEREQSDRILLNYGHTIGHALEQWSAYRLHHGEAVAIGMCAAAGIARRMGLCDTTLETRQRDALLAFDLQVRLPHDVDVGALLDLTLNDKKVRGQRIRWVLPTAIGAATVRSDVPQSVVRDALAELSSV